MSKRDLPKQPHPDFPLDKEEMTADELIRILQKLPPNTKMQVRAGAYADNAYVPQVRVWLYQGKQVEATLEPDYTTGHHYNYPEGYSGVEEITSQVLGEIAKVPCHKHGCSEPALWQDADGEKWCDKHRHSLVSKIT